MNPKLIRNWCKEKSKRNSKVIWNEIHKNSIEIQEEFWISQKNICVNVLRRKFEEFDINHWWAVTLKFVEENIMLIVNDMW